MPTMPTQPSTAFDAVTIHPARPDAALAVARVHFAADCDTCQPIFGARFEAVAGNTGAITFYQAMGAVAVGRETRGEGGARGPAQKTSPQALFFFGEGGVLALCPNHP
jgi:hypothetical protein